MIDIVTEGRTDDPSAAVDDEGNFRFRIVPAGSRQYADGARGTDGRQRQGLGKDFDITTQADLEVG